MYTVELPYSRDTFPGLPHIRKSADNRKHADLEQQKTAIHVNIYVFVFMHLKSNMLLKQVGEGRKLIL